MKTHLIFLLAFAFTAPSAFAGPESELRKEVRDFVGATMPNRSVGQPGHAEAIEFLQARFGEIARKAGAGARVFTHEFLPDVEFAARSYGQDFETQVRAKFAPASPEFKKWRAFTLDAIAFVRGYAKIPGRNVILELLGSTHPQEVLYVGAHFDTITHDHSTMKFTPQAPAPGADDNAAAVAALLAVAREVAAKPRARTVRFVAFDYEEIFFLGSLALARDVAAGKLAGQKPGEKMLGLINLEMIGWTSKKAAKPVVKLYARAAGEKGADADLKLAQAWAEAARAADAKITPTVLQNGFNRSDNWSFWQAGLPAVCVTQDWEGDFNEKRYHTAQDTPETLNYGYVHAIARGTAAAVETLVKNGL